MADLGLIQIDRFATQVGQLRAMASTTYGDHVPTSVTTINLLVYQESNEERQTNPIRTEGARHAAVLDKDITVSINDHITNVVDKFGNVVLADARVADMMDFHHWD
jgi:hypothetical protein